MEKQYTKENIKRWVRVNENGCWEWQRAKNESGYGLAWFRKKLIKAHRLSFVLFKGEFDKRLCVCHLCDNPGCINPKHLWLGTYKQNIADCLFKERKFQQKLTKSQVLEIVRAKEGQGNQVYNVKALAKKYGVVNSTISRIANKRTWKSFLLEGEKC